MDHNLQADSGSVESRVEPAIKREQLDTYWIGLGAALEWIALRGQPTSTDLYRDREEKADQELVDALADMPAEIAEALVRGEREDEPGILVQIPSGIWRQTAISDANDNGKPFRLVGTDEDDPWEGAILGERLAGYRKLQIHTAFVLETWPEHSTEIRSARNTAAAPRAAVRRLIEKAIAMAGDEITLISHREMLILVQRCLPNARRTQIREIYAEFVAVPKRGPKGSRNPDRQRQIDELGQKLVAAQLHN